MTHTYTPMVNDRQGFDPMGGEWSYILDEFPVDAWRPMVARGLRHATWPYAARGHDLRGNAYYVARLAPDWCYYAWRNEYVGVSCDKSLMHVVQCRIVLERRYAPAGEASGWPQNPFAGEGNDRWRVCEWTGHVVLDLRDGSWVLDISPYGKDHAPAVPDDVYAEAQHKAFKLLAFFRAECARWRAGNLERPVQARDLYKPTEQDN
jgi:hypothetical protein